jgi:hypothetical protein
MPSTNQCIGSYYDELKHRVFYFNYNSAGYHGIYIYDVKANSITPLLISFVDSQEDIFSFDPKFPIVSVNILYRTEEDGDVLHWTDRNQRPMKLNIKDAIDKIYGTAWKKEYLTVARKMPLEAPICQYSNTTNATSNNLKSKLFQFSYRWVYKDDTKSTWSPWSKLFAPYNIDDLTSEKDLSKNNVIDVQYNNGSRDCYKIEISARETSGVYFTDRMLVDTITKTDEDNNSNQTYKFYNNGAYPFVNKPDSDLLFDYVPKKANAQELINGSIVAYAGITEGNTFNQTLSVTATTEITPPGEPGQTVQNLTVVSQGASRDWNFIFSGTPVIGDKIDLTINLRVFDTWDNTSPYAGEFDFSYSKTVTSTDTLTTIRDYFKGLIDAESKLIGYNYNTNGLTVVYELIGNESDWLVTGTASVTLASGQESPTDLNISSYKHSSTYSFGLVYFDEFGVTNGVVTSPSMKVTTPKFASNAMGTDVINSPIIKFDINHAPPSWAKTFSFVRTRNMSLSEFVWVTTNAQNSLHADTEYGYLNISEYNANKSGYPTYAYKKGDRVKIYGRVGYTVNEVDLPILSVQTVSPNPNITDAGYWLKVPYDSSIMAGWSQPLDYSQLIEPYTPFYNTQEEESVYYEFGENYPIIKDSNNNLVHGGESQNQIIGTGARPAKYTFYRGDVYVRRRGLSYVIDMSVSDKYDSKVDGNGRPFVIDNSQKEIYYPTLIRYSGEYEQGTNVNKSNKFYYENLDEYDRQKGDIQRLKSRGQQLRVFQNRACGVVPVSQNVIQTADGGSVVSQSSEILNKIQYYQGEYGIGEQYCSLASSANADYFTDPVLGCQVRLGADGITSITETYKAHFFFTDKITKYQKKDNADKFANGGYAKILGVYDSFEEEFITVMQGSGTTIPDYTFGFSEPRNAYSAFYDYNPEWITVAGNVIISWKSGELWVHNNTSTYANFYGVQQTPSIKLVFNQAPNVKKHYNTVTLLGNTTWTSPLSTDIRTNMNQNSTLAASDYKIKDDKYHASFRRDINSAGGLIAGKALKGSWIELNLKATNPQNLVDLYYAELGILQPLNNR